MPCSHVPAGMPAGTVTISLHIVNSYAFYPTVTARVTNEIIPASPIGHLPRTDTEYQAFDDWAYDHIYPFTGVGHVDGDCWYDVTVTACSASWLVGHTFAWGY